MRRGTIVVLALGTLATQRATPRSAAGGLLQEAPAGPRPALDNATALRAEGSAPSSSNALGLLQGSAGLRAAPEVTVNTTRDAPSTASAANRDARAESGESTILDRMEKMMLDVDYDAMNTVMSMFGVNMSESMAHMKELQAKQLALEAHERNLSNHFRTLNRARVAATGNLSGVNINVTSQTCEDNRLWRTFIDRNYTLSTGYVTIAGEPFDCTAYANQGLCVDPAWFGRTEGPCVPNRNKYFLGENFSFPEKNCCACGKQQAQAASQVCTGRTYPKYQGTLYGGEALGLTVFATLLSLSF